VVFSPNTGPAGSTVTGTVTNPASVAGIAITGCGVSQVVPASAINQTTGVFTFVIPIGQAAGSCSLAFASLNTDGTPTTSSGPFTVTSGVTTQTYTVTPTAAQTVPVTNVVQYTATGLGTVPVDIQLFNCANVTNTSGTVTFPNSTNPGGTGNFAQQGVNTGQITVLNGAPTGLPAGAPDNGVTPVSGQATFSVTDATAQCVTPVVFQQGAAGANQNLLPLGTNNQPTVPFGVGGSATFGSPTTVPAFVSATAGSSQVDVFYNQTINPATLDTADFTVTATLLGILPVTETVSTVAVNGTNGVTLTVTPALIPGATVLVTAKTGSDGNTVCSTGSTTNCQAVGNAVQATA
jgi:hypothetical protein